MNPPAQILKNGGIVLYPTDTLYGLGVDALNVDALKKLKELKGRDEKKPISIIVADIAMAKEYADVTPLAEKLATAFLPGKLTLVLSVRMLAGKLPYGNFQNASRKREQIPVLPEELTAGTRTVGIRIPKNIFCTNLARDFGRPLTATSANVAGEEPQSSVSAILAQFGERAAMIDATIDAGELLESPPSTVVDARGDRPVILREGAISNAAIRAV